MPYFKRKPYSEMIEALCHPHEVASDVRPPLGDGGPSNARNVGGVAGDSYLQQAEEVFQEHANNLAAQRHGSLGMGHSNSRESEPALAHFREQVDRALDELMNGIRPESIPSVASAARSARTNEAVQTGEKQYLTLRGRPEPVVAGRSATIELTLFNDDPETPGVCAIQMTGLIAASGCRIPDGAISVSPKDATIPPRGSSEIQVRIQVPASTPPGTYYGLLQTEHMEDPPAIVRFDIVSADSVRPT